MHDQVECVELVNAKVIVVEVFRTDVQSKFVACKIIADLLQQYPSAKINFDLDDCDKILRIENEFIVVEKVIEILAANGFKCETLE